MLNIGQRYAIGLFILTIFETGCLASDFIEEGPFGDLGVKLHSSLAAKEIAKDSTPSDFISNASCQNKPCALAIEKSSQNSPILELRSLKEYQQGVSVTVVVDVFRAFTTASYVLENQPETYMLATKSTVISRLASELYSPFLIGKPEKGAILTYNIPNSPTRVKEIKITGRNILHRTEAGAKGVLDAKGSGLILVAGFVNADATVQYISKLINPQIKLVPMGHEATTPSLEDDVCAQYIEARLKGENINLMRYHTRLREGPGRYFFSDDQWQYPWEDFECCIEVKRFNFAIQADVKDDYAILTRCD